MAPSRAIVRTILDRAAELVSRGWTRRALAVDATDTACASNAPEAQAWCLLGAIERAELEAQATLHNAGQSSEPAREAGRRARDLLRFFIPEEYRRNLLRWEEAPGRTRTEVLALIAQGRTLCAPALKGAA